MRQLSFSLFMAENFVAFKMNLTTDMVGLS